MQLSENTQLVFDPNHNPDRSAERGMEESKDYDLIFSPEFQNQTTFTNQNTTFDEKSKNAQSETSRAKLV